MITHKFAIVCAEVLRQYCEENFQVNEATICPKCIFSRKDRPKLAAGSSICNLESFITGRYGEELQNNTTDKVELRLKELQNERN